MSCAAGYREVDPAFRQSVAPLQRAIARVADEQELLLRFLRDILAYIEGKEFAVRWGIARHILDGARNRSAIARAFGTNHHTAKRVEECTIGPEATGGYAAAVAALARAGTLHSATAPMTATDFASYPGAIEAQFREFMADLCAALGAISHDDEMLIRFLRDLLTLGEVRYIDNRWQIAQLLLSGARQGEIITLLGTSAKTVSRVDQYVRGDRATGGCHVAWDRMGRPGQERPRER